MSKRTQKKSTRLHCLIRIGFFNNYDLAVTPELAQKYGLKTYSDLAKVSKNYILAADYNFLDRVDCYPLLKEFLTASNLKICCCLNRP